MITYSAIRRINGEVNSLPYKSDAELFGTPEFWAAITESGGDCEDFSIAKYHRLLQSGATPQQLRFATCFVEPSADPDKRNRYHCVLLIDLDDTTYVLDNRYPNPNEHNFVPYEWHKIQIAGTQTWEWALGADRSFG